MATPWLSGLRSVVSTERCGGLPHRLVDDLRVLQWHRLVKGFVHQLGALLHVRCKVEGFLIGCRQLLCYSCLHRVPYLHPMLADFQSELRLQSMHNSW